MFLKMKRLGVSWWYKSSIVTAVPQAAAVVQVQTLTHELPHATGMPRPACQKKPHTQKNISSSKKSQTIK